MASHFSHSTGGISPKKKHNNKKKKTRQIQIQITAESQETKEERAWTQTPSIK